MKNPIFIIGITLITIFSSCKEKDSINNSHAVGGSVATIEWQECVYFTDHNITVCFIEADENRCPCDTECLWEGSVDATFHVTLASGGDTTFTLTTNSNPVNLPQATKVGDKIITFVNTDAVTCADFGNYEKYRVVVTVQ